MVLKLTFLRFQTNLILFNLKCCYHIISILVLALHPPSSNLLRSLFFKQHISQAPWRAEKSGGGLKTGGLAVKKWLSSVSGLSLRFSKFSLPKQRDPRGGYIRTKRNFLLCVRISSR